MANRNITDNTNYIGEDLYKIMPFALRYRDDMPVTIDGQKRNFFERFLYVFGKFYQDIRTRYIEFLKWHNPLKCPSDILDYLASNVGWNLDSALSEEHQRIIVKNAMWLYKHSGTKEGIWGGIYSHTGLNSKILFPGDQDTSKAHFIALTRYEYTGGNTLYIKPEWDTTFIGGLSGLSTDIACNPIFKGFSIWVYDGRYLCNAIVESVACVTNSLLQLTLQRELPYAYEENSFVIVSNSNPFTMNMSGIFGHRIAVTNRNLTNTKYLVGETGMASLSQSDETAWNTLVIQLPYEPTDNIVAIITAIIEYMKPLKAN